MHKIYIESGENYREMTFKLLEAADLKSRIPDHSCRIGIKPNLVSETEASWGATTHPEIVGALIEYLQNNHFTNLAMLEGSWVGGKTSEAIKVCGYDKLSEQYHVPFLDMQREKGVITDCGGMELSICAAVKDIDFLINVPVLKGHCQTKITCALKNMKGLIPNAEKRRFHSLGLHKPIAHLNTAIHQDFILVDNICGDLDFEDGGNPVLMNRVMAATDPVLLDAYVCHLMHYDVADVPYIGLAESLGVGCADITKADIISCGSEEAAAFPRSRKVVELADAVQEVDSCSACYGYLIPALDRLKEEGLLDQLQEKICIGQGYRHQTGELGIGHCTAGFRCHLDGCPPVEQDIYHFLKSYILGA